MIAKARPPVASRAALRRRIGAVEHMIEPEGTQAQNQRPRSRHATATTIRAATSMMRTNKVEESMRPSRTTVEYHSFNLMCCTDSATHSISLDRRSLGGTLTFRSIAVGAQEAGSSTRSDFCCQTRGEYQLFMPFSMSFVSMVLSKVRTYWSFRMVLRHLATMLTS